MMENLKNVKIAVPLTFLSNFWRALAMLLIEINFTLRNLPSTKDNVNLTKQLNEGLKRPVYWNE